MVITGIGISVLFSDTGEPAVVDEKVTQVRVLSISETSNDEFAKYIGVHSTENHPTGNICYDWND
jgi:hypothetical protein